jgi:RNA polymerase sigma-70 factor, ECF subfamily
MSLRHERDLIEAILAGDSAAFDELFARHATCVRQRLLKIVRDEQAAEDLLQEVFLRLWTRAEQYNGSGPVDHWLIRMATNLALNHLRSQRRRPTQPLEFYSADEVEDDGDTPASLTDSASCSPAELYEKAEQQHLLQALLRTLPDAQREVLELMLHEQMGIGEIAQTLGIPPGTVKSRLHYARRQIGEQWPDEP